MRQRYLSQGLKILPRSIYIALPADTLRSVKSSPLGHNGRHFTDDVFKCIFVNEKFCILNRISLKFVAKRSFDKKISIGSCNGLAPSRRQPLHEPMLAYFVDVYMRTREDELSSKGFLIT